MSTDREPHVLIVKLDPGQIAEGHVWTPEHRGCEECEDNPFDLTVECPGLMAGRCASWEECETCRVTLAALDRDADRDAFLDEAEETGVVLHGVPHLMFGRIPCVETSRCFVREAHAWGGGISDDLWDIARDHGPGLYQIDWEGGEMYESTASLIAPIEPATTPAPIGEGLS